MSGSQEINISEVIEERKFERKKRAEERRLEDLKLIESINRKNDDGINPLKICPKEMWEVVSSNLVDSRDLENLKDSCTLFRDLLEDRALSEILFSKCLYVDDFRSSLDNSTKLNLRLVCKTWRNVIDHQQRNGQVEKTLSLLKPNSTEPGETMIFDYVSAADNWSDSLKSFEAFFNPENYLSHKVTPKRPNFENFLVMIGLISPVNGGKLEDDMNEYEDILSKSLHHVGSEIWKFGLHLFSPDSLNGLNLSETCKTILEITSLMPNLHCLKVLIKPEDFISWTFPFDELDFENGPIPFMKNLKQLDINLSRKTYSITEAILRSNQHIQSLVIHVDVPIEGRLLELIQSLKLASLSFTGGSLDARPSSFTTTLLRPSEDVDHLLNASWHLKQIKLELSEQIISMPGLFRMFGRFPTLETVILDLTFTKMQKFKGGIVFLDLPNLINFQLFISEASKMLNVGEKNVNKKYFISIDYLLYCKKLEKIKWENKSLFAVCNRKKFVEAEFEELIQFRGGLADFNESNIWKVFPFLQSVELLNKVYHRSVGQKSEIHNS